MAKMGKTIEGLTGLALLAVVDGPTLLRAERDLEARRHFNLDPEQVA
jgi:hypothetical protein